jgi:hypothetical protein
MTRLILIILVTKITRTSSSWIVNAFVICIHRVSLKRSLRSDQNISLVLVPVAAEMRWQSISLLIALVHVPFSAALPLVGSTIMGVLRDVLSRISVP